MGDERRRFERVQIGESKVYVADEAGNRIGRLRDIGRGGMFVETRKSFPDQSHLVLHLVDESEGINRRLRAIARYATNNGLGFEFLELEPDAAVEIGVIIGKYYSAQAIGR
jgi:hypothetical protein